jgi:hypothetical protein
MAPENQSTGKRVILVEGDPVLGMNAIVALKREMVAGGMLPDGWVEMSPPSRGEKKPKAINEFLNALDGELSLSDWDGNRKCVFLRGLLDNKQFSEALPKAIAGISPSNTLILFDETGVMGSEKGSWASIREACQKAGTVMSLPPSFASCSRAAARKVSPAASKTF